MPTPVTIKTGDLVLKAEINASPSSKKLLELLPLEFSMSRWGDEYYGDCGINTEISQDARDKMEVGELAVWPTGRAFCIFFGPTPASHADEPRAVSPVNPVGKLTSGTEELKKLGSTINVRIETSE